MLRDQKLYESPIQDYAHLLAGRKAFITTAARGIGKSIAILFARQGADVYFAGRNEEYVRGTEEQLRAAIWPTASRAKRSRRKCCATAAASISSSAPSA